MDPMKVLGLSRPCTESTLKSTYRRLARQHHPDKAGPASTDKFAQIQAAYDQIIEEPSLLTEKPRAENARVDSDRRRYEARSATHHSHSNCNEENESPRHSTPDSDRYAENKPKQSSTPPGNSHTSHHKSHKHRHERHESPLRPLHHFFDHSFAPDSEPESVFDYRPSSMPRHSSQRQSTQAGVSSYYSYRKPGYSYEEYTYSTPRSASSTSRSKSHNHHSYHSPRSNPRPNPNPVPSRSASTWHRNLRDIFAQIRRYYDDNHADFHRSVSRSYEKHQLDEHALLCTIDQETTVLDTLARLDRTARNEHEHEHEHKHDREDLMANLGMLLHQLKLLKVMYADYGRLGRGTSNGGSVGGCRWRYKGVWDVVRKTEVSGLIAAADRAFVEEGWEMSDVRLH